MSSPSIYSDLPCQVCRQPAHGKHFRAVTCRPCAAFFRRSAKIPESLYNCERKYKCGVGTNGRFTCKGCKMKKCLEVKMDSRRFQFGRDLIGHKRKRLYSEQLPETMEHLSGRSSFIIYMDPQPLSPSDISFINLQYLIDKGSHIMRNGSATPIFGMNTLEKLMFGLKNVREKGGEFKIVEKIGKEEAIGFWEKDFLTVAKWLTYFDDFQKLPMKLQIEILKSIWHIWIRLEKLAMTAMNRRRNICGESEIMVEVDSGYDMKNVEMDISWFTKYPKEKLKFLFDEPHEWMDTSIVQPLMDLQPTDIELTFMLGQLCFEYAGKRHQGEILKISEKFQELLANDLHDYYINEMKMTRYSRRIKQMMNINNLIQQDIREKRVRTELAKVFPIYCVEFSHPEIFEDIA